MSDDLQERKITLQLTNAGRGEPRFIVDEPLIDVHDSGFAAPTDWHRYHHPNCGTKFRGCDPELCPKDHYERTGVWLTLEQLARGQTTSDFTALSDDDLQSLAAECRAEAERCYKEARRWRVQAGEHAEQLRRISLVIMERRGWFVKQKPPQLD